MGNCKSVTNTQQSDLLQDRKPVKSILKYNTTDARTAGEVPIFKSPKLTLHSNSTTFTANYTTPRSSTHSKNFHLTMDGINYRVPFLQDVTDSSLIRRRRAYSGESY